MFILFLHWLFLLIVLCRIVGVIAFYCFERGGRYCCSYVPPKRKGKRVKW